MKLPYYMIYNNRNNNAKSVIIKLPAKNVMRRVLDSKIKLFFLVIFII